MCARFRVTRIGTLALAALAATPSAASAKPVVAVFTVELRANVGVRQSQAEALTSYLSSRLGESGRFEVVPQARFRQALAARRRESHKPCYDQACQIEIGQELAAQLALVTQIHRLSAICVVTSNIYDLRRATSGMAATARGNCTELGLLGLLDQVVGKLARVEGGAAPGRPLPAREPGAGSTARRDAELIVWGAPDGALVRASAGAVRRECRLPCRLQSLAPATYALEVSSPSFVAEKRSIKLGPGHASALSIELRPAPPSPAAASQPAAPTTGTPLAAEPTRPSPMAGVALAALTRETRARHDVPAQANFGIVVESVAAGSVAARRGLKRGDVILEVNGAKVDSVASFRRAMARISGRAQVLIHRRGQSRFLSF